MSTHILMENERDNLDIRFNTSRKKELRNNLPTVQYYHDQRFLPSTIGCPVFIFDIPDGIINESWGRRFTILGSPGALITSQQQELFKSTYEALFKARGCDIVSPFAAAEYLCRWGGHIDHMGEKSMTAYEACCGMSTKDRKNLVFALRDGLRLHEDEIIITAKAYGVLNTLTQAERLIRFARYDAELD